MHRSKFAHTSYKSYGNARCEQINTVHTEVSELNALDFQSGYGNCFSKRSKPYQNITTTNYYNNAYIHILQKDVELNIPTRKVCPIKIKIS